MTATATLTLLVLLTANLRLGESRIQKISQRPRYFHPKNYTCMEDWNKTCTKGDDCCSGICLGLFCKIVGLKAPGENSAEKPRRRKKMRTWTPAVGEKVRARGYPHNPKK